MFGSMLMMALGISEFSATYPVLQHQAAKGSHMSIRVFRAVLGKMKLRLTLSSISLLFLSSSQAFPDSGFLSRVKRDDCAAVQASHGECTTQ